MFYKKKNTKDNRIFTTGFTLVELLVAMAVFGVLMSLAIGVFVSAMRAQRNLTDLMSVNNNLNLVLEQVSREMRMGYFSKIQLDGIKGSVNTGACLSGLSFFTMQTNDPKEEGESVAYSFSGNKLWKDGKPITSEEVNMERLCFTVYQYDKQSNRSSDLSENCNPWRVGIALAVKPKNAKPDVKPTYIETAVSMRVFPIEITKDPYQCRKS